MDFKGILNGAKSFTVKHSPEILTGIGISGMIASGVLAVKATPKALKLIDEEKKYREKNGNKLEMDAVDTVKVAWKCYIPAVSVAAASALCLIASAGINKKRTVALAAACSISEKAFNEYRNKTKSLIGANKDQKIRSSVRQDKLEEAKLNDRDFVKTGRGTTPCYDALTGRAFYSDKDVLDKAIIKINRDLVRDGYVCLNDFYNEIGLDGVHIGDILGWNVDDGLIELEYGSYLLQNGVPCLSFDYASTPVVDYSMWGK